MTRFSIGERTTRLAALLLLLCSCLGCVTAQSDPPSFTWDDVTDLDNYVHSDDGYYSWEYLVTHTYTNVTVYVINMTSQKWQDESFSDQAIWWHMMGVAVPDDITHPDAGFLFIDGGSNYDDTEPPDRADLANTAVAKLAKDTGACAGYIKQVPNQPIIFTNDPNQQERKEDSIIAWTWRTFIDDPTPDPTVVLRMPMTKAAKRGLDTIHEVAKDNAPSTHIDRFAVGGASKRGWTTWSIASTDQRVIAMFPMVFSLLNINDTIQNHFQDMDGAWSFAFQPYWAENLTQELYNPRSDELWVIEDMYRYRDRLAGVYKLEIVATGDEFFLCDDSLQWWDGMPDPKYMKFMANTEHSMTFYYLDIYATSVSMWISILEEYELPSVTWIMQETDMGGLIVVDTIPQPVNITAWSATTLVNDTRRDFRLAALHPDTGEIVIHPVRWYQDISVVDFGNGYQYGAAAEQVDGEWVGFFIEATWDGPPPHYYPMTLTTQVNVVPYTRPHEKCRDNVDCYAYLV